MVGFEQAFGKSYLVPPETPAERVAILRQAFAAVLKDKEFLAEAEKVRIEITAQSGEEVQRVVENAYASTPAVIERLRKIVSRRLVRIELWWSASWVCAGATITK